ncbi:MAG: hypothetical protein CMJ81_08555 [Planctomycetaceae bacterium]|nr:hypothetical protein [Planctomycetaceae bacterium]
MDLTRRRFVLAGSLLLASEGGRGARFLTGSRGRAEASESDITRSGPVDRLAIRLGRLIDWDRDELAGLAERYRAGDVISSVVGLVAHLRRGRNVDTGYSAAYIRALRESATGKQKLEAEQAIREGLASARSRGDLFGGGSELGPVDRFQIGLTEDLSSSIFQYTLTCQEHWHDPNRHNFKLVSSTARLIRAIWPLDECADVHLVPQLCRLVDQADALWRQWRQGGDLLSTSGHNQWLSVMKGLYTGGLLFPEIPALARFAGLGPGFFEREIGLLIAPDGFTRERSSSYQWGVVQRFVLLARLMEANGVALSPRYHRRLQAAVGTAWKLVAPDGRAPTLGDKKPVAILDELRQHAARFGIGQAKFIAQSLEPTWQPPYHKFYPSHGQNLFPAYERLQAVEPDSPDTALTDSGYYVMRRDWSRTSDYACLDAGARGNRVTSHDHAAMFNLVLYSRGRPVLVHHGAGGYGDNPERRWRVGSSSHNVSTVDGQDHLPVRSEWRFDGAILPTIDGWRSEKRFAWFSGVHEGYQRLPQSVICRRKLFYLRGEYWILIDRFHGVGQHDYQLHFQVGPPARLAAQGRVITSGRGGNLAIVPVPGLGGRAALEPCPFPYGSKAPHYLTYSLPNQARAIMVTLLVPFENQAVPRIEVEAAEVRCGEQVLTPWEATALNIMIDGRRDFYYDHHMHWSLPWRSQLHASDQRLFHARGGPAAEV